MFSSGSTYEASLIRGRRKQSIITLSGGASERRRNKYAQWQKVQHMFKNVDEAPGEEDEGANDDYNNEKEEKEKEKEQQQTKREESDLQRKISITNKSLKREKKRVVIKCKTSEILTEEEGNNESETVKKEEASGLFAIPISSRRQISLVPSGQEPIIEEEATKKHSTSSASSTSSPGDQPTKGPTGTTTLFKNPNKRGSSDTSRLLVIEKKQVSIVPALPTPNQEEQLAVTLFSEPTSRSFPNTAPLQFRHLSEVSVAKKKEYFSGRLLVPGGATEHDSQYNHHHHRHHHHHHHKNSYHHHFRKNYEQLSASSPAFTSISKNNSEEDKAMLMRQRLKASSASRVSFAARPVLLNCSSDDRNTDELAGQKTSLSTPSLSVGNSPSSSPGQSPRKSTPLEVTAPPSANLDLLNEEEPIVDFWESRSSPLARKAISGGEVQTISATVPSILGDNSSYYSSDSQQLRLFRTQSAMPRLTATGGSIKAGKRRQSSPSSVASAVPQLLAGLRRLRPIVMRTVHSENDEENPPLQKRKNR